MSGQRFFAHALHPFLRYRSSQLPPPRNVALAFADDLAIVPSSLLRALPILVTCLSTLASATNLCLNATKTTIIPLFHTINQLRAFIIDNLPTLQHANVTDHGRYLGISVGPAAHLHHWEAALPKYTSRCLQTRSLPVDFFSRLAHYHTYALTTLTYIAQLQPPTRDVLAAETHALQLFTAGPYNAIPSQALQTLRDHGYNSEGASISLISQASALRLALTLPSFHSLRAIAFDIPDDDDFLLSAFCPQPDSWCEKT